MAQAIQTVRPHPILLEGKFPLHPKSTLYDVTVISTELCYTEIATSQNSKKLAVQVVKFSDVIGCDCMRGKTVDCISTFLNIYIYAHSKKFASKVTLRKRHVLTLVFSHFPSYAENEREAQQWQRVISHLIRNIEIRSAQDIANLHPLPERRLLVLVNPFSGPGKALHIFQQRVVPVFAEAGLQYHLTVTEHAGHAEEIAKSLKLSDWYGVIIVSGDGLIYEVINGLMARPDWEKAIKMPIGTIPGGSGNALACSIAYLVGEPYLEKPVLHASFIVAKHSVVPMDLTAVDTCGGRRLYSFLGIAWGIISDVDIESERFRSLGNTRFTVGAVIRIVDLRKYRGRISFLPVDVAKYKGRGTRHPSLSLRSDDDDDGGPVSDNVFPRSVSMNDAGKVRLNPAGAGAGAGDHPAAAAEAVCGSNADGSVRTELLPPIDKPVPRDWITVEDDFTLVIASTIPHLAQDSIAAPASQLADGIIHLGFTHANVSRLRLIKLFTAMQDGVEINDPSTEIVKVRAFRLDPLDGGRGRLTVDGEMVEYGPIQAQVLPSMARVMSLARDNER